MSKFDTIHALDGYTLMVAIELVSSILAICRGTIVFTGWVTKITGLTKESRYIQSRVTRVIKCLLSCIVKDK